MRSRPSLAGGSGQGPASGQARVLIVDDSAVARTVLGRMVDATDRFAVVASLPDARSALAYLRANAVDLILLDVEMPGVDGIAALPDLVAASKGARVLIVSSMSDARAAVAVQALALGAADTLPKPGIGTFAGRFADVLKERMERLLDAPLEGRRVAGPMALRPRNPALPDAFDVVAIGASTGGIHALGQLLRAIPASFPVPILVTQHLPVSFMGYFAAQLAVLASRPAEVATDHVPLRPGRIIVAPGNAHMRTARVGDGVTIRLSHERAPSGCMPSIDPMFTSVGETFGARAIGVVLSGMGRDGSIGARDMIDAGACVVVQDQASSVVWGMPGAVATAGGASAILPPDEIGRLIASRRTPT